MANNLAANIGVTEFAKHVASGATVHAVELAKDVEFVGGSSPARELQQKLEQAVLESFGNRSTDQPRIARHQVGLIIAIAAISWIGVFAIGYALIG